MGYASLHSDWRALLERRPTFRGPLAPYGPIFAAWAAWAEWPGGAVPALDWPAEECHTRWRAGVPLLADAPPVIPAPLVEDLAEPVLAALADAGADPEALRRFAEAWDQGEVAPVSLFPERGRIGAIAVVEVTALSQEAVAFLAQGVLRPVLESYFAACVPHLGQASARVWDLGICPCCAAPPGASELEESGQRRLVCHLCGTGWSFSRLRCPYCGSQSATDVVRLLAEDADEGYAIFACKGCQGYVKELDRRLRWNAGAALVEDWGSPHLDVIAHRAGYWRAVPTLIQPEPA